MLNIYSIIALEVCEEKGFIKQCSFHLTYIHIIFSYLTKSTCLNHHLNISYS